VLTRTTAADSRPAHLSSIDFPADGTIVIALSGGSDSTALLTLARDVFSKRGEAERLLAVTVDHGLRPDSAAEARRAGDLCASLGIAHGPALGRRETFERIAGGSARGALPAARRRGARRARPDRPHAGRSDGNRGDAAGARAGARLVGNRARRRFTRRVRGSCGR
jgi:hypothetical protein